MRRLLGLVVIVALALPFAAAFGGTRAPCCCKGAMTCALQQKASCAASCSMTAPHQDDAASIAPVAAQQALSSFVLSVPVPDATPMITRAAIRIAAHSLPPDPPPPRA